MANKDKEKYNAYMKDYMLRRYHKRMQAAKDHLGGKCVKCGALNDLELDHIDRSTKSFTIGNLWSVNEKRFWEEVNKCQLLCMACHEQKTLIDMGQKSARLTHGTLSSYRYCKCAECKAAKSAYSKKMRMKKAGGSCTAAVNR